MFVCSGTAPVKGRRRILSRAHFRSANGFSRRFRRRFPFRANTAEKVAFAGTRISGQKSTFELLITAAQRFDGPASDEIPRGDRAYTN